MPNASPADVRAGWEVFHRNPDILLEALNRELERRGRGPVAERSLRHYRSLLNAGFDRYVSVNRFDVARASRPYESASATPRYFYYGTHVYVEIRYVRQGTAIAVKGIAERIGEVGALITFDDIDTVKVLREHRPTVNAYITIYVPDVEEEYLSRVIESEVEDREALIEVEFTRVQSISDLAKAQPISTAGVSVRLHPTDNSDRVADLIGRRIYYALEAVEASRAVINEVLRSETERITLRIADPPELRRLGYRNPVDIVLIAPPAIGSILVAGWLIMRSGLKSGAEFYAQIQAAKVDRAISHKIEAEARKLDAEAEVIRSSNSVRLEREKARKLIFQVARQELKGQAALTSEQATEEATGTRRANLADDLLDSADGLRRQEVDEIELRLDPPPEAA